MSKETPALKLRDAVEADAPFIFNSWLKAYRNSKVTQALQNEIYFNGQHKLIEGLVKRAKFIIACNPADETQIYGYSVGETIDGVLCVHFVYVKEPYRKFGIATGLLLALGHIPGTAFVYTHRTHAAEKLEAKGGMVYYPYLAYYGYEASSV